VYGANAIAPVSPMLRLDAAGFDTAMAYRARQYTVGGTATTTGAGWTHALTAGLDGYRLAGASGDAMPIPSLADSALAAARGRADRLSMRLHTSRTIGDEGSRAVALLLGAEHSTAWEHTAGVAFTALDAPRARALADQRATHRGTGALAQARVSLGDALFLTAGGRLERVASTGTVARTTLLPLLGVAAVRDLGALTAKVRAGYGRGIRPARTIARAGGSMLGRLVAPEIPLDPESQTGIEIGTDLLLGQRLALHVTRFDQRVADLVQPVATLVVREGGILPGSGTGGTGAGRRAARDRVFYELQNVGAIDNRGWEAALRANLGPATAVASLATVDSRVARVARGYRGDLRAGDRMLEVPRVTSGAQLAWAGRSWSAGASIARASDWINYDKIALAAAVAADTSTRPAPLGAELRRYWRTYDGVTRLGAQAAFALTRRTRLTVAGENLLDRQDGEPDNVTVVPGRTITLGVRTAF